MFNLGLWEIFILAAVALVVVGPEKLPKLARDVARFLNEVKRTTGTFTNEMNRALDEEDFQKSKIKSQEHTEQDLNAPEDPLARLKEETEELEEEQLEETTEEKTDV